MYLKAQLIHNQITIKTFLEKINLVFYLSTDFDAVRQYFSSLSKQRACHKVWGGNTMFYRCKTCALSVNSSICYECFANGPHEREGHDYTTSFSSYGGSCDCGLVGCWKESGFCNQHSHSEQMESPTKNMKQSNLISAHLVVRCILSLILELNNRHRHAIKEANINACQLPSQLIESYSLELLTWIETISKDGHAISHVISEELCYLTLDPSALDVKRAQPLRFTQRDDVVQYCLPEQWFRPPLAQLLLVTGPVHNKLIYLVLYLLCESTFKFGFARIYAQVYAQLSEHAIDSIIRFSPQIFSIASITLPFSRDYTPSFIDITLDLLQQQLSTMSEIGKSHLTTIGDIKAILQLPTLYHFVLFEKRSLLLKFLKVLKQTQGLDQMTRMRHQHIEYDKEDWVFALQLEIELREIFIEMVESIGVDTPLDDLLGLIDYITNFMGSAVTGNFIGCYHGVDVSNTDLFEATASVSLINPLFRFYMLVVQRTIDLHKDHEIVRSRQLLPQSVNLFKVIYPFVLCQVYVHQVNNGYWVRNNDSTMRRKAYVYCQLLLEGDLSLIQTIASVVDMNQFVIFCSKEFAAFMPASVARTKSASELQQNDHRYHQFLKFIIQLYQERSSVMAPVDYVNNCLAHHLYPHSKTHSKIEYTMMHLDKRHLFDEQLAQVADVQSASGDQPAVYKIKTQYWRQFNPYYPLYTLLNVEEALGSYYEYKGAQKLPNPTSLPLPPALQPLTAWKEPFGALIHNDNLHHTILLLLNQFVEQHFSNTSANSTTHRPLAAETPEVFFAMNECLYLLVLALTHPSGPRLDTLPWATLMKPRDNVANHGNAVLCIMQRYRVGFNKSTCTFEVLLDIMRIGSEEKYFVDKKDLIGTVIDLLYQYHVDIQEEIVAQHPSFKQAQGIHDDDKISDMKLKAKKRQAEIMARLTQQQNKFLQNAASTEYDDTESNDEDTCVLCLKGQCSDTDPLCMIALYQLSTLSTFSKIPVLANLPPKLKKHCKDYLKYISFPNQKSQVDILNYTSSLHLRGCGHYIHSECFDTYSQTLIYKASHHDSFEGNQFVRPLNGEFLCPMCRRISNIIIPIMEQPAAAQEVPTQSMSPVAQRSTSSASTNNNDDGVDGGEANKSQLAQWFSAQMKGKTHTQSSQHSTLSSHTSRSNSNNSNRNLFFFNELNKIAFKGGSGDTISPYFLAQLTARNIEFLEIATREIQGSAAAAEPDQPPQFCIGQDVYSRDIVTIKAMYRLFKDHIHLHKESKYRECTIELFKGMTESILSIDPFSSYVLFLYLIDSPNNHDIDIITNLSLDVFITQFIITKMYSNLEKKKKVSLQQLVAEYLDGLQTGGEESTVFYADLIRDIAPFLRCLCLAQHAMLSKITHLTKTDLITKDKLFANLGITSLQALVNRQRKAPLHSAWINRLEKSQTPFFIMEPRRPTFIDLPNTYHEFFIKHINVPCNNCKQVPTKSAICLLCGHLICIDGSACCLVNSANESTNHINVCGIYKIGVFLETKNPNVVLIRDHRKTVVNNAFLDHYGEPDSNLDRGKPLYRNDHNLQELWSNWISHCLEEKYLSNCNLQGRDY
ncbi:hypothetical protein SAMD00019534_078460 [Acytostelium subglobosum LB1]|uniref:hypothetical protein n=1 Tax=Acytostelium subglobosum LB1 TaxID=1410327 RepID=UPI000644BF20|nr:hypothetical protein SAMD00019534_078460 [Acytostelium subglobosum LB1]GAM24671.1 hypothetical protein SAMD00019534_078460 [Acytostelium subglobosum LB1]|eukprot:XP_012752340.1 hypothetical protein SAMD00019534_078460 [Acytostelium subglobosum LB1]